MNSKKGLLMTGVSVVFAVLVVYSAALFFIDRSDVHEQLALGGMVVDVLAAEKKANEVGYYLEKSGQYALLKSVKKTIEEGFLDKNCEAFYSSVDCKLNVYDFGDKVGENVKGYFGEYLTANNVGLNVEDYEFDVVVVGGKVLLMGDTDEEIDFGDASAREMEYKKSGNFRTELEFAFSQYLEAIENLEMNLPCLLISEDKEFKDDLGKSSNKNDPKECLNDRFSNVEKRKDMLSFDYEMDGALFESKFNVPFIVDLKGIEDKSDSKDISTVG